MTEQQSSKPHSTCGCGAPSVARVAEPVAKTVSLAVFIGLGFAWREVAPSLGISGVVSAILLGGVLLVSSVGVYRFLRPKCPQCGAR
ncbi:MAG: hypothetical protein HWE20_15995 [Gammaproteobacteria bacterium]|nr:hypothetical protein [Gammaproteobacteria bacterium]